MPPDPLKLFLFLNQLQISSTEKIRSTKNVEIMPVPFLKFLAAALPALFVGAENLIIGFAPPLYKCFRHRCTDYLHK